MAQEEGEGPASDSSSLNDRHSGGWHAGDETGTGAGRARGMRNAEGEGRRRLYVSEGV